MFIGHRISITILGLSVGLGLPATAAPGEDCLTSLEADLVQARAMADISPYSSWGVALSSLDRTLTYQFQGDRAFVPASNVKLFTTAAALLELGSNWQTLTQVYWNRDRLILRGGGDPTLTRSNLEDLAAQTIQNLSEGTDIDHLILDDGYFQGDPVDPHWEWEDTQAGYGAPVNATIIDRNAIPLTLVPQRVGRSLQVIFERPEEAEHWILDNQSRSVAESEPEWLEVGRDWRDNRITIRGQLIAGAPSAPVAVSLPNPADYALTAFQQALSDRGLFVADAEIHHAAFGVGTIVAVHPSPPLEELITTTNQQSDNLVAETLLRHLGVNLPESRSSETTRDRGLRHVRDILQRDLNLNPAHYTLQDGSGLSRQNSIAPEIFVSLLQGMASSPAAETFIASLPVLGESGTLKSWTPLTSGAIVQAKTGSMTGIYALSGYLSPLGSPPLSPNTLAFSIIINHSDASYAVTQAAVADFLAQIDQFQQCRQSP